VNDILVVNVFLGVHRHSQSGRWCLLLLNKTKEYFASEKQAARVYRDRLALHNKHPKASSSQYRGEPLRANVTGPLWPDTLNPRPCVRSTGVHWHPSVRRWMAAI
jgi:hypothetical protein